MQNHDNRLTSQPYRGDTKPDSADVLMLLQVVERLYEAGRSVINSHSAAAVLMAMAVELQTLLAKLQAMQRRWEVHLPFKEASTVDFMLWSSKAAQMAADLRGGDSRYCMDVVSDIPSCHCLADLYDMAVSGSAGTDELAAREIESDAKEMLIQLQASEEVLTPRQASYRQAHSKLTSLPELAKYLLTACLELAQLT